MWKKKGKLTMEQKAANIVDGILKNHTIDPLTQDVQAKIKAIVKREQDWIEGK